MIIETRRKGRLVVHNRLPSEDAIYISAPPATAFAVPVSHDEIVVALNAAAGAVSRDMPLDLIDAGLRTLIVPISTLDHELAMHPDQKRLRRFCLAHDIDIILTFCLEVAQVGAIAHTRVFAPSFGLEGSNTIQRVSHCTP